jgi:type I restriction enzyme R subunit
LRRALARRDREKDRATVEATFAQLLELASSLDAEQRRAAEEGLSDDELALFDLLFKSQVSKADRERLKQASKALLESLKGVLHTMSDWAQTEATRAEVRVFILDTLYRSLPRPPYTESETEEIASSIYDYVWGRNVGGTPIAA